MQFSFFTLLENFYVIKLESFPIRCRCSKWKHKRCWNFAIENTKWKIKFWQKRGENALLLLAQSKYSQDKQTSSRARAVGIRFSALFRSTNGWNIAVNLQANSNIWIVCKMHVIARNCSYAVSLRTLITSKKNKEQRTIVYSSTLNSHLVQFQILVYCVERLVVWLNDVSILAFGVLSILNT